MISVGELPPDLVRRLVVGYVARMYYGQLARDTWGPLENGFINRAESAVCGSPSLTQVAYPIPFPYPEQPRLGGDGQDWGLLVRLRMATNRATPPGELLQMQYTKLLQPHYAEGWTLVGLLNEQPAKFGKLLLEFREPAFLDEVRSAGRFGEWAAQSAALGKAELAAIEKVYGWDEKKLNQEWHAYVMGQGDKSTPKRPEPGAAPAGTGGQSARPVRSPKTMRRWVPTKKTRGWA